MNVNHQFEAGMFGLRLIRINERLEAGNQFLDDKLHLIDKPKGIFKTLKGFFLRVQRLFGFGTLTHTRVDNVAKTLLNEMAKRGNFLSDSDFELAKSILTRLNDKTKSKYNDTITSITQAIDNFADIKTSNQEKINRGDYAFNKNLLELEDDSEDESIEDKNQIAKTHVAIKKIGMDPSNEVSDEISKLTFDPWNIFRAQWTPSLDQELRINKSFEKKESTEKFVQGLEEFSKVIDKLCETNVI